MGEKYPLMYRPFLYKKLYEYPLKIRHVMDQKRGNQRLNNKTSQNKSLQKAKDVTRLTLNTLPITLA